ncbi:MAG TPA: hypothetical protein VGF14_08280 [Alphaproteobacteria bacterium]
MEKNWILAAAFLSSNPEVTNIHQNKDPSARTYKEDLNSSNKNEITAPNRLPEQQALQYNAYN